MMLVFLLVFKCPLVLWSGSVCVNLVCLSFISLPGRGFKSLGPIDSVRCVYINGPRGNASVVVRDYRIVSFFFIMCTLCFSDQLYFALLHQKVKSSPDRHCFCIDEELSYEK